MNINVDDLKKIIDIFDESTADKIEIESDIFKIKFSRNIKSTTSAVPAQLAEVISPASAATPLPASEQVAPSNIYEIKSPIVGTFYRAPSPDSDPFVEIGSKVKAGDTLCIVEAMKLMNEIETDVSGVIEKILVNNSDAVEYNQPIFLIKPE